MRCGWLPISSAPRTLRKGRLPLCLCVRPCVRHSVRPSVNHISLFVRPSVRPSVREPRSNVRESVCPCVQRKPFDAALTSTSPASPGSPAGAHRRALAHRPGLTGEPRRASASLATEPQAHGEPFKQSGSKLPAVLAAVLLVAVAPVRRVALHTSARVERLRGLATLVRLPSRRVGRAPVRPRLRPSTCTGRPEIHSRPIPRSSKQGW
eukprot:gene12126-biopygen3448